MRIRPANEEDLPLIVALMKASLGESLMPKSEELWRWKHLANPFGKSPVLLAEDQGRLVGVRAFLRWEFAVDGKIIQACRAVDTATHPDFQGTGIFSKLTLALLNEIRKEGIELIFNTPNAKSSPGYLKMGWERWGNLPLKLNFHLGGSGNPEPPDSDWKPVEALIQRLEDHPSLNSGMHTRLVPGYLKWRYVDIPLFPYQFISDGENYLLVYRIKAGTMGKEFRICDLFICQELSKSQIKEFNQSLTQRIKSSGARFSSFSGLHYPKQQALAMGLLPVMKIGPLVMLRDVAEARPSQTYDWNWSLGDLEVF